MLLVVLSVVFVGGFAPTLIRLLSLDREPEGQFIHDEDEDDKPRRSKLQIRRKDLFDFDARYIRPFFTKPETPTDTEKGKQDMELKIRSGALDEHERNGSPSKKKARELFNAPDDM